MRSVVSVLANITAANRNSSYGSPSVAVRRRSGDMLTHLVFAWKWVSVLFEHRKLRVDTLPQMCTGFESGCPRVCVQVPVDMFI